MECNLGLETTSYVSAAGCSDPPGPRLELEDVLQAGSLKRLPISEVRGCLRMPMVRGMRLSTGFTPGLHPLADTSMLAMGPGAACHCEWQQGAGTGYDACLQTPLFGKVLHHIILTSNDWICTDRLR